MTMFQFPVEWALRSSILVLSGALLLRALRVRDPSIRLAAWTAILGGSLALPALAAVLPSVMLPLELFRSPTSRLAAPRVAAKPVEAPQVAYEAAPQPERAAASDVAVTGQDANGRSQAARISAPFDWARTIVAVYFFVALTLLLRLFAGLLMSLRLLRKSDATGEATEGIEIRESERVTAPVTLGIIRPAILLPAGWREWDQLKLEAVLAHERSHVRRHDPAVQLVSVIHRALLWHSPLSWYLHKRIVQAAEEASDDAAVAATQDRACYAEVLLGFMQGGALNSGAAGVPMARYGDPGSRVQRILDEITLSRGITKRGLAAIVALGSPLAYVVATAQARPAFEIADVHAVPFTNRMMEGGILRDGRYELRHATMLELIKTAYGVDTGEVFGGPSWLEWSRFDLIAKAPPDTPPQTVKLMLQALLADRFKLVVHKDTRPLPGFVLSGGKDKPKVKKAEGSEETGCQRVQQSHEPGALPNTMFSCHNMTMDAFAQMLHELAPAFSGKSITVVDSTGLDGSWDFDMKWGPYNNGVLSPGGDGITIFDAIDKQLGLKLELQQVPQPVILVDSGNEKPTDNPPGLTRILPPPPQPEFEVASIRPCGPNPPLPGPIFQPGGRVHLPCLPLEDMIRMAWSIDPQVALVGAPSSLSSAAFEIIAKAPAAATTDGTQVYNDDLYAMLRALLVDRFKMAIGYKERPVDAYTLVAAKPKLKKADPSNRTGCKRQDVRLSGQPEDAPPLGSAVVCQNITMSQFAEWLQSTVRTYIHDPVLNATGIEGSWDFSLTFSLFDPARGAAGYGSRGGGGAAPVAGGTASDPVGGISLFDALERQLGLKLEKRKRPLPVLVIDHMEEKPTDN
jgi:uncharacterized protein (TIGR03435 family)